MFGIPFFKLHGLFACLISMLPLAIPFLAPPLGPDSDRVAPRFDLSRIEPQAAMVAGLSLAAADVDRDGMPDLLVGCVTETGGALIVYPGNVDAIFPNSPEARERKKSRSFTANPFPLPYPVVDLAAAPDFLVTGDFDNDGTSDVVAAARGEERLLFLRGDGQGGFAAGEVIDLPGAVTALRTGELGRADALVDLAVAVSAGPDDAELLLYRSDQGALNQAPVSVTWPAEITDLAMAHLDEDYSWDLAFTAGDELVLIPIPEKMPAPIKLEAANFRRLALPAPARSLSAGRFGLALLLADGSQTTAATELLHQVAGGEAGSLKQAALPLQTGLAGADLPAYLMPILNADKGGHLLLVLPDLAGQPALVPALAEPDAQVTPLLGLDEPAAAILPMRLNGDAAPDLVVLEASGALVLLTSRARAEYVVNSSDDSDDGTCDASHCSLREAILAANASPGLDSISFAGLAPGDHTIQPQQGLPEIVDPLTLDATTHPDNRVEIDGQMAGQESYGLWVTAGSSLLRGVVINRFQYGLGIYLEGNGGNFIEGNFLGLNFSGALILGSQGIGIYIESSSNTIGGMMSAARNVSSGQIYGIELNGENNVVIGNYIGTDVSGSLDRGNEAGLVSYGQEHFIGGMAPGAGNLISGNYDTGIILRSSGTLVLGNLVGTDGTGLQAVENGNGVEIYNNDLSTIGGTGVGAGNVISGNYANGIYLNSSSQDTLIFGNYIGTDASGTLRLGNSFHGVFISGSGVVIGGASPGAGNLISGNGSAGIRLENGTGCQILGNFIGTDISGTQKLGNSSWGIAISNGAESNIVGGTEPGSGNLISGNYNEGISIFSSNNMVIGNKIGTDISGTLPIPNRRGFYVSGSGNQIGGASLGEENIIAYNLAFGIGVSGAASINNSLAGNIVFNNGELGIDLGVLGRTLNDSGDADSGPNQLQNFPQLLTVEIDGMGNLIVNYHVDSDPSNAAYDLNVLFYEADSPLSGEGRFFLGADTFTAGDFTNGGKTINLGQAAALGVAVLDAIVAVATDSNHNTSEYSDVAFLSGPATPFVVNSDDDSDDGRCDAAHCSLREAIIYSNFNSPAMDTIAFNIPGAGPHTIVVGSALPDLSDPVILDGNSQPGPDLITLKGSSGNGLKVSAGGCTIKGFAVGGFSVGIDLEGPGGNHIEGNHIGVDASGTLALPNSYGIRINSPENTIGGETAATSNIISGNYVYGVQIYEPAISNIISGNFIGADVSGSLAVGNGSGMYVASSNNTIGGNSETARNVISGNGQFGITLATSATGNILFGNYVGVDSSGLQPLGNNASGIRIDSNDNFIGGNSAAMRNVISGNGTGISNSGDNNTISGNYLGLGSDGTTVVGNTSTGISTGGQNNLLGGTAPGEGNLITGNKQGISLNGTGQQILGNWIGLDATGLAAPGNSQAGIYVSGGEAHFIGDGTSAGRNVISGNQIGIEHDFGQDLLVRGNFIGTDPSGTIALGNLMAGIELDRPCQLIWNLVSGNGSGVYIIRGTEDVILHGNLIGVDSSGLNPLGNQGDGIRIQDSQGVVIGGAGAGMGNVISANGRRGIRIGDESTTGIVMEGNIIGLDANGSAPLGNLLDGIRIENSGGNRIGGSAPGAGNLIAANSRGIYLSGQDALENQILGNRVGMDAGGSVAFGNTGAGIEIDNAPLNQIGGSAAGAGNLISGNGSVGLVLRGTDTFGTRVMGNRIGTNAAGTLAIGNGTSGLLIQDASGNTIGGSGAGEGNLISGNALHGLKLISKLAVNNLVAGNLIGTAANGADPLGNGQHGIAIEGDAGNNHIGDGNTIAYNGGSGIRATSGIGNELRTNRIHDNAGLGIDLGDPGPAGNDVGDGDVGANQGQNHPFIDQITVEHGSTFVDGAMNTAPSRTYTIELFSNTACDASGYGEGETPLGTTVAASDGSGNLSFQLIVAQELASGAILAATATDANGNTSELGPCAEVQLFADGFESGDTTAWMPAARAGTGLEVNSPARYGGGYGLRIAADGDAFVGDDTPQTLDRYRVRFYARFDGLQMSEGDRFDLLAAGTSATDHLVLTLVRQAGANQVLPVVRADDGTLLEGNPIPLAGGWHALEFDWQAGAGDGYLAMWLDGVSLPVHNKLTNGAARIDELRWGLVAGHDAGTSGHFDLDDFVSHRYLYIGLLDCAPDSVFYDRLDAWPIGVTILDLAQILENRCP